MQDEIVSRVVTTLGLLFKVDEMKLPHSGSTQPTENLEAFDDLLRGTEYYWRATKDDSAKARQWGQKAIDLDPKYAQAYAGLGWILMTAVWNQWSENPRADLEHASELAQKALAWMNPIAMPSRSFAKSIGCIRDTTKPLPTPSGPLPSIPITRKAIMLWQMC